MAANNRKKGTTVAARFTYSKRIAMEALPTSTMQMIERSLARMVAQRIATEHPEWAKQTKPVESEPISPAFAEQGQED